MNSKSRIGYIRMEIRRRTGETSRNIEKHYKRQICNSRYTWSASIGKSRIKMNLTKLLLSKLVQACEKEWMPDNDGGLFGEPKLATDDLKELKRLIYRPKNNTKLGRTNEAELIKR